MNAKTPEHLQQLLSFNKPIIDTMTRNIAILDESGIIVQTNKAWDLFNKNNGGDRSTSGVGVNYLTICKNGNKETYQGLVKLMNGELEEFFCEYPCHSQKGKSWFMMYANLFEYQGEQGSFRGILVEHIDITKKKLLELKTRDDLELARKVQHDLLPMPIKEKTIKIDSFYLPCDELSGDIYYWKPINKQKYIVAIFDIVGHGIPASLLSMNAFASFTYIIEQTHNLREIVMEMNDHFLRIFNNHGKRAFKYSTAIILLIDTKKQIIEYINCGHPPALFWNSNEEVKPLGKGTVPLGIMEDLPLIEKETISYHKNSRLFIYTDGLFENMDVPLIEAQETLVALMQQESFALDQLINPSVQSIDDITMLLVELNTTK